MKIKSNIFLTTAFSVVIFGGAVAGFAQENEPFAGGYIKVSLTDKQVIEAAGFAVKKRGSATRTTINLLSIESARRQIVAGTNYKICLRVQYRRRAKGRDEQFIEAVVFRSLKNVYSLTGWKAAACAGQ
jgi:hypothetical protein